MSEMTYSFTVTGKDRNALVVQALKRAQEFFDYDTAPIRIEDFDGFHVDEIRTVGDDLIAYSADCRVTQPMHSEQPALKFS
jgi:hypothetical protein